MCIVPVLLLFFDNCILFNTVTNVHSKGADSVLVESASVTTSEAGPVTASRCCRSPLSFHDSDRTSFNVTKPETSRLDTGTTTTWNRNPDRVTRSHQLSRTAPQVAEVTTACGHCSVPRLPVPHSLAGWQPQLSSCFRVRVGQLPQISHDVAVQPRAIQIKLC